VRFRFSLDSDRDNLAKGFSIFSPGMPPDIQKIQLVHNLRTPRQMKSGEQIYDLATWLAELPKIT
jgi:hypothetical protein